MSKDGEMGKIWEDGRFGISYLVVFDIIDHHYILYNGIELIIVDPNFGV